MAYTNNDILNIINFTIRKDTNGQPLTQERFTNLLDMRGLEYFEEMYDRYEQTQEMTDSLRRFKVTNSSLTPSGTNYLTLPTGSNTYAHSGYLIYKKGGTDIRPVEIVSDDQFMMRQSASIEAPSSSYPIARFITDYIEYLPATLDDNYFTLSYLKYPTPPVYDYYIDVNGIVQYLAEGATHTWTTGETDSTGVVHTTGDSDWTSLTVELDFNEEDKLKIAAKILQSMSVPINEAGVFQYAEKIKNES